MAVSDSSPALNRRGALCNSSTSVKRALEVADLLANPHGRYHLGRRNIVFNHSPNLYGHTSWGRPDVEDVRELVRLCEIGIKPEAEPHAWLVDLRELEFIDPLTFGLMVDYVRRNAHELRRKIIRQAQLRPDGMVGAIISGFSHVARLPYQERVFSDVDEALDWLGVERSVGVGLLDELRRIRSGALELHPAVAQLRATLEAQGPLTLASAARVLGLSTRSLQRALSDSGTSYRAEFKAFQVRRAQHFLREGSRNLAWIANEVGFSSLQHFATAFKRATGEAPSAYRVPRDERDRSRTGDDVSPLTSN